MGWMRNIKVAHDVPRQILGSRTRILVSLNGLTTKNNTTNVMGTRRRAPEEFKIGFQIIKASSIPNSNRLCEWDYPAFFPISIEQFFVFVVYLSINYTLRFLNCPTQPDWWTFLSKRQSNYSNGLYTRNSGQHHSSSLPLLSISSSIFWPPCM